MRPHSAPEILGVSRAICELREEIQRVAFCDAKVLITGESGVGKDLVARSIHRHSTRASRAFVALNCAGISETLLESELFGHVRGSFTGAYRDTAGKLEVADGGTLFLDELGEMTPRMQGLLLRFLETGELQRVGAERVQTGIDVRVIASTNADLRQRVLQGSFREDLYYRLNVVHLVVPPLRERREDIPVLIEHFLSWFSTAKGRGHRRPISPEALQVLGEYAWPGNVRELANLVERLVVTGRREIITPGELPPEMAQRTVRTSAATHHGRMIVDELYQRVTGEGKSFWVTVYPLYMRREITKECIRDLVRRGLEEARGNYKIVAQLFNMESSEYKRFLSFLRKHDCHVPFMEYRQASAGGPRHLDHGDARHPRR